MSPFPTTLLGLVLCLGCMIHTQDGVQPTPSIRADPRSVIPRGRPVTIVCRGPAGVDKFRLEKMENISDYKCQGNIISQPESQKTEARFHIPAMTEDTAGLYRCLYHLRGTHTWSNRSEPLELKVTDEDVSTLPSARSPAGTRMQRSDSMASVLAHPCAYQPDSQQPTWTRGSCGMEEGADPRVIDRGLRMLGR
ncbi:leukocyte-associated immunoglobulin-like receptor 2 [Saccopteryx leptura]|uniref:leukocyte-associated immunoglobulin-like receptor 2 n=1 Tax=Saccopteryx leptura TaxID=249018 RepID=UPI00339CD5D6